MRADKANRNDLQQNWPSIRNAKQRAFLSAFSVVSNITRASAIAGVDRVTVWRWKEHDEAFSLAYRIADEMATEALEQEAWRRAVEGVIDEKPLLHRGKVVRTVIERRYSDALLALLLKARKPEVYRENLLITNRDERQKVLDAAAWNAI